MAIVKIEHPTEQQIEYIGNHLRAVDRLEAVLFSNLLPMAAVRESVAGSSVCRVATVDDEPVCIFGIAPGSDCHLPWMVGTDAMDNQPPLRIMAQARKFMSDYSDLHLRNVILADNAKSIRFLLGLGFSFSQPFQYEGFDVRFFERRPLCV